MENEIILTDQNFDEQIKNNSEAVLVDFWAPWCMPCRIVAPILSDVAKDYTGRLKIAKVNVDENPQLSASFQIMSIPTLILFKNGKPVDSVIGALPRNKLITFLSPHLDLN